MQMHLYFLSKKIGEFIVRVIYTIVLYIQVVNYQNWPYLMHDGSAKE